MSTSTNLLPAETRLGTATIKVSNLQRSLDFYQRIIGFQLIQQDERRAVLGTLSREPLLILTQPEEVVRAHGRTTGLYHIAILLPDRASLGQLIAHIIRERYEIDGAADHLVSEAFYLGDPDGNGLELYRDRPRSSWQWTAGEQIRMSSDPIDVDGILRDGATAPMPWQGLPVGTTIGHMHLRVSDLEVARNFYLDVLGFEAVASMTGALFVSAGKYHHHLGLNTWQSRGASPAPAHFTGLEHFTVLLPKASDLDTLRDRLQTRGIAYEMLPEGLSVTDPAGNALLFQSLS